MSNPKKKNRKQAPARPAGFSGLIRKNGFAIGLLIAFTFIVYARSLFLGYTRLDDSIFIVENAKYNADAGNLVVSFQRGLFNPTKDAYYRPLFLVDFILESRLFGVKPAGYHFTNLLFHLLSVTLLFLFLRRLKIPPEDAFLLSLLFAVHPVLTQAVAWIPGRNDLLLMIFFFSSFILLFRYLDRPSVPKLILHILLLVAALFTKETAVIIPVIMGGFLLIYGKYGWKKLLVPGAGWIVALALFFFVRSKATLTNSWVSPSQMMHDGLSRLGVIVQYLGKIFLPVNLTVFPEADQITLAWGILAAVLLTGLVIWSKSYRKPLTWLGLAWFLIFLVPVLVVPKSLNDQVFEHRLYIPIIGILLMLSQVFPFGETAGRKLRLAIVLPLALIFSVHTLIRIGYFDDSITFWTHAVKGSPRSAYARTLLGTKVTDTTEQLRLFREARSLDPHLKNLNYYLGKVLFDRKQMDSAAWYIRQEVKQNPIPDAYFLLAQIAFLKNDFDSAAILLEKVVELNPTDPQANHNLVLLYWQHGHPEKSKEIIRNMQQRGMEVGDDLLRMVSGK